MQRCVALFIAVIVVSFTCQVLAQDGVMLADSDSPAPHGITKHFTTSAGVFTTCTGWGDYPQAVGVGGHVSKNGGVSLEDHELGMDCQYNTRGGAVHSTIILPTGRIIYSLNGEWNWGILGFIDDIAEGPDGEIYLLNGLGGTAVSRYDEKEDHFIRVFDTRSYVVRRTGLSQISLYALIPYGGDDVFQGVLTWTNNGWIEIYYTGREQNGPAHVAEIDDGLVAIIHNTSDEDNRPEITYFDPTTLQFLEISREL